jgi:30S ribosomal protein S31
MGKGDKKSKRGKITIGSYGKTRRKKAKKAAPDSQPKIEKVQTPEVDMPKKVVAKKPAAKKPSAKKPAAPKE